MRKNHLGAVTGIAVGVLVASSVALSGSSPSFADNTGEPASGTSASQAPASESPAPALPTATPALPTPGHIIDAPATPTPSTVGDDVGTDETNNPLGWKTNIGLISSLTGVEECLFRNEVFPAGGVGYENSALPYDGYNPTTAAFLTLRAETLRNYPNATVNVVVNGNPGAWQITIIALENPQNSAKFSLEELSASDAYVSAALATLEEAGATATIDWTNGPSLVENCAIADSPASMEDADGNNVTDFILY